MGGVERVLNNEVCQSRRCRFIYMSSWVRFRLLFQYYLLVIPSNSHSRLFIIYYCTYSFDQKTNERMVNIRKTVFAVLSAACCFSYAQNATLNATLPAPAMVNLESVVGALYRPPTIGPEAGIAVLLSHAEKC